MYTTTWVQQLWPTPIRTVNVYGEKMAMFFVYEKAPAGAAAGENMYTI